jgi:mycofactocin system transcriptional regulator
VGSADGESRPSSILGRPVATSHAAIEAAAFRLFAERGFQNTTMEAIAAELGIGRRTLFRYFESKNDIPWGQFSDSLDDFGAVLDATPSELPLAEAVHRGVIAFNDFGGPATDQHRMRMRLILGTPALQAHSVLKYGEWRRVIADFVAARTGQAADAPLPRLVGQVSLALALSAYETWLADEDTDLLRLIDEAMSLLKGYLGS